MLYDKEAPFSTDSGWYKGKVADCVGIVSYRKSCTNEGFGWEESAPPRIYQSANAWVDRQGEGKIGCFEIDEADRVALLACGFDLLRDRGPRTPGKPAVANYDDIDIALGHGLTILSTKSGRDCIIDRKEICAYTK
jgi:hypothetical protein